MGLKYCIVGSKSSESDLRGVPTPSLMVLLIMAICKRIGSGKLKVCNYQCNYSSKLECLFYTKGKATSLTVELSKNFELNLRNKIQILLSNL